MNITLIIGKQCTGKTTLARKLAGPTGVHVPPARLEDPYAFECCTPFTKAIILDEVVDWDAVVALSMLGQIEVQKRMRRPFTITPNVIITAQVVRREVPAKVSKRIHHFIDLNPIHQHETVY